LLDLNLPMQSVLSTAKVVIPDTNCARFNWYNFVIELVSDFPEGTLVSSTNKIDYHYIITEMLLNVALYTNKSLYINIVLVPLLILHIHEWILSSKWFVNFCFSGSSRPAEIYISLVKGNLVDQQVMIVHFHSDCICGIMVSMLASSAVDRGFEPWWGQFD
jgi:hypothetical protein